MDEVTLKKKTSSTHNVFLGSRLVGQYYPETKRFCATTPLSEAVERKVKQLTAGDETKVSPPPPKIPEAHQV